MVLLVTGIFAFCVLAVLFAGTDTYNDLTRKDRETYQERTCTRFLVAKVRQADGGSQISVGSFSGSDALIFDETIDGEPYRTFLYCYDGWLREYFAGAEAVDMELDGELGTELVPAERLVLKLDGALLRAEITQDGKTSGMVLSLRSREAGGTYEE